MRWRDQLADDVGHPPQAGQLQQDGRSARALTRAYPWSTASAPRRSPHAPAQAGPRPRMPLIELGEISPGSDPGPGPDRGYDRRLVRRIGVVLTALLCVLTAAGSARPDPHDLRTLWTIPSAGDDFAFAGETAFVLAPEAPLALGADPTAGSRWGRRPWSGNGRTLTAYDVRDGSVLWARQVDVQASYVSLADRADRLLLPARFVDVQAETPDGTQFYGDVSQDVVALDTRTGATVWQRPGDVYAMTADTVLLSKWDPQTSRIARLTMVRLADGAVLWSRAFTAVTHVTTAGPDRDPESVVVATFDGRVEVMSWSDGTPSATAEVPWVPYPVPEGWYADLTAVGDTLYVSRTESMRTVVTAYAIGELRRKWQITAAFIGTPTGCGPVLCVSRGNGMAMYDPATGALRWEAEGWTWASEIAPGRLLAETAEQQRHAVLDATTGRVVADLGDAFALWDQESAKVLVLQFTTQPAGFSSVTELDPGTGRSWLRGKVVAATEGRCMLRGGYLACHHLNGALTVTDVG